MTFSGAKRSMKTCLDSHLKSSSGCRSPFLTMIIVLLAWVRIPNRAFISRMAGLVGPFQPFSRALWNNEPSSNSPRGLRPSQIRLISLVPGYLLGAVCGPGVPNRKTLLTETALENEANLDPRFVIIGRQVPKRSLRLADVALKHLV